ncbi:dff626ff-1fb8-4af3-808f-69e1408821c8 [Thermothielavioides terrestris]|uniref:lytic cellulose monooxygenase (C4-dehydrogenating) n=2 Tax=Thermothielavioides terrestris TaxID=2587410 RepID=G2QV07_THETT|nr:glycoside hydrolase family 61 protein [Thermothielavioides terrestris NRRL 8126]AEO64605.1 glycoside hydrolase family 61 protein [Thermothielavioides terrestris NRRL 8126]SPQ26546.1 dff626ff-1fb8-4af3-808f-69e1408821c8 [Thermothielavioides terrestris]
MKLSSQLAALTLAAASVSGHYIFEQIAHGGTKFPPYEYIRRNTNYNSPVTSLSSNDLRCNVGGETAGNTTVLDVKAGDSFTFYSDVAVYHQGPISLYMSKAPGSVVDYDGSGDWFKIHDWGPTFSNGQASWPLRDNYQYNIPTCIPNGEYLLRIQSLAIHNPGATPQFYISCAQVRVSGGGSASPSPTAKIPGAFKATDPGYTANIYNNFHSYTVPGPAVFQC